MKNTLMFLLASLMLAVCLTACGGGQTNGAAGENGGQSGGAANGSVMENGGQTGGTANGSAAGSGSSNGTNDRSGTYDRNDGSLMDDARDAVDDAGRSVRGALDDAGDAMDRAF